jgi:hypothetical protein
VPTGEKITQSWGRWRERRFLDPQGGTSGREGVSVLKLVVGMDEMDGMGEMDGLGDDCSIHRWVIVEKSGWMAESDLHT